MGFTTCLQSHVVKIVTNSQFQKYIKCLSVYDVKIYFMYYNHISIILVKSILIL